MRPTNRVEFDFDSQEEISPEYFHSLPPLPKRRPSNRRLWLLLPVSIILALLAVHFFLTYSNIWTNYPIQTEEQKYQKMEEEHTRNLAKQDLLYASWDKTNRTSQKDLDALLIHLHLSYSQVESMYDFCEDHPNLKDRSKRKRIAQENMRDYKALIQLALLQAKK